MKNDEKIDVINDAIEALAKVGGLFVTKDFDKSKQVLEMQKELVELRDSVAKEN